MRNIGITDGICRILREVGKPMQSKDIASQLPLPEGWTESKRRQNVCSILIQELRLNDRGRWIRVSRGKYIATPVLTWIRPGILIQHQKTGAILKVTGKVKRNNHETTLHRWMVTNPITKMQWGLWGEDIERDWKIVKSI